MGAAVAGVEVVVVVVAAAGVAAAAVVDVVDAIRRVREVRGKEDGGTLKEEVHHMEIPRAVVATEVRTDTAEGREESVVDSRERVRRPAKAAGSGGVLLPLVGVRVARGIHRTRKVRPLLLIRG